MQIRSARRLAVAILAIFLAPAAHAHSQLEGADPEPRAVLERSPPVITLRFKDAVRLTSVIVRGADGAERKLSFAPTGSAQQFSITEPALTSGRSEIRWKALSRDGHVIDGALSYIVNPSAKSSP